VYVGQGTSTNVVFAVAEKSSYNLIPASAACEILKDTDVKCLADAVTPTNDSPTPKKKKDNPDGESDEFPLWIIYTIAGLLLVAFIIMLVVIRRKGRRAKKEVCVLSLC
jgi:hypothetical protein